MYIGVGRQGKTIHDMCSVSKARILVERSDTVHSGNTRKITITGTPETILHAKVAVT